jgi:L-aminopeptidase/D-esterase-like protein
MGFPTAAGPVPIVVAMGLFDLLTGDGSVRPGAAQGYDACTAAVAGPFEVGPVGAGTGATIGKWQGREHARPAGLGTTTSGHGDVVVAALVAVNAFGDIDAGDRPAELRLAGSTSAAFGNTTIGVIATNAAIGKLGCLLVAQGGHDGLARALSPVHTRVDGDAIVAAAVGGVDADVDLVRSLAVDAVARAIRSVTAGRRSL